MVQCIEAISETLSPATPAAISAQSSVVETSSAEAPSSQIAHAHLDLNALNRQFEQASPQEILAWCIRHIPDGLAQATSFSMLAVTHMLYQELSCRLPVIFLDTLHLFPETLETAAKAKAIYDLDLRTYHAVGATTREAFAERYGEQLWARDIDQFYALTKVEPLQRALDDLQVKAWITGRRRDQSQTREAMPIFERTADGRLKINPIANWTRKDIWAYTFQHGVLYNPLHDQGYTSIGDQPLTTPTSADENERAGRWRGSEKTECGIHS